MEEEFARASWWSIGAMGVLCLDILPCTIAVQYSDARDGDPL